MQKEIIGNISSILPRQNTRKDTHKTRKPIFPNWKQQKESSFPTENLTKIERKIQNFFEKLFDKVSGKSHSAENPNEAFMLAKRFQ